jgi:ParB-like nuclease domain
MSEIATVDAPPVEEADQKNGGQGSRQFGARAAWNALKGELDQQTDDGIFAGKPDQQNAGRVILRKIEPLRELFQPRGEHEKHVKDLADALKIHGELEPLTVAWTGKRVILIEGHHRYTAYWRKGRADKPVPVRWFKGSIKDAVALARSENSKAKLPMTTQERQNAAWLMVRLGDYTRPEIIAAAGVSDGQIGTMRRVLREHMDAVVGVDSWYRARQTAAGRGFEPFGR